MLKSMTGYGRAVDTMDGRTITVEVKSVNHRYFDCTVKASRMYGFLEDPVKKLSQNIISRGKVDIYVSVDNTQSEDVEVTPNRHVLGAYLESLRALCIEYRLRDDITITELARFPEAFTITKKETDADALTSGVITVLEQALNGFNTMREREGARMAADITARSQTILQLLSQIEERAPQSVAEYREKLEARIREYLGGVEPDEGRLLTEVALFADRVAIDEETVRLRSHFAQLEGMLIEGVPVGRKLDFLVQEMNREANTVGSKTNDLETTKKVVEIKAELEKIREQVQNIE